MPQENTYFQVCMNAHIVQVHRFSKNDKEAIILNMNANRAHLKKEVMHLKEKVLCLKKKVTHLKEKVMCLKEEVTHLKEKVVLKKG